MTSAPPFAIWAAMTLSMLMSCAEGATDENGVAKVLKEKNDNSKSGNSDQELPSQKLSCYHRLYNWDNVSSITVTCDSQADKCAYVYVHYYDAENKRIDLLSQHCNHYLSKRRRESHCERMKKIAKDSAATPFASCEMAECNTNLCNTPFKRGMRPAYVVLIALSASASAVVCLAFVCCMICCCRGGGDDKKAGGSNENRGQRKNTNRNNVVETRDENNNNNNVNDSLCIDVDSTENNKNNNNEDGSNAENKNEEEAPGPEQEFQLVQVESDANEKSHSCTTPSRSTSRVSLKEDL